MAQADTLAIILAAGMGTRMKSESPKVMHRLAGRSMLGHVLAAVDEAGIEQCMAVIGPDMAGVEAELDNWPRPAAHVVQAERLGTAHAVLQARERLMGPAPDRVLVLYGDTPLLTPHTLRRMAEGLTHADCVVLGFEAEDPEGYGRLLLSEDGALLAIREHADATDEEKSVTLCNSGVMAFRGAHILDLLEAVGNENAKGEYYLTDAIEIAHARGLRTIVETAPEDEVLGINSRMQLSEAEYVLQNRLRLKAMEAGATLIDPDSVFFCHDTVLGRDVTVEPNVVFGPGVRIGDGVQIKAFSHLEGADVEDGAVLGPFARLRPGAHIGAGAKVGNFVEIKKSEIESGAKVNHLTYIGDAVVGAGANIGAGTITCNYDGFNKYQTRIGAGAFIGSNSALVAPVSIGDGAYVGSGSVITRDVEADALAVGRGRQMSKAGWAAAFRARSGRKQAG
ncbi:MAG: bifunctional N-acetylglucosamine-1-phosphate uridyltransferase/glucosamine-1-phosphate acetyltransferase [Hyphomicrobiales bacterium]|nr:MAG: bifunctional N-acetylglucosamine-1-phosphate uridyltransferase/glucosamine-1-phosphate acetyltransferase [Hyphomicrobiales bacterium]